MEECVFCSGAERAGGSCETADVVVGREACWCWTRAIGGGTVNGGRRHRESCGEKSIWGATKSAIAVVLKDGKAVVVPGEERSGEESEWQ